MPITKNTGKNSKTISKSTKKKQASKASRALAWLKPTTPAKGILLFVIVFGIVGGGYMVYKSYAATMTNYYNSISNVSGSVLTTDTASKDKNATKVWSLPHVNSEVTTTFSILGTPVSSTTSTTIDYTPCITVRRPLAALNPANVQIAAGKYQNAGGAATISVANSGSYTSYCMNGSVPFADGESGQVVVSVTNQTGGSLYLQSIYLGSK